MIDIQGTQRFHGHRCPGLATGIRVAEVALREIGPHSIDEEVVAIVETDNCAVDAIQYLTGCTFGKGNLIHRDYGKNVFTGEPTMASRVRTVDGKPYCVPCFEALDGQRLTRSRWGEADGTGAN